MTTASVPVSDITQSVSLTAIQLAILAEIPYKLEWFAKHTRANTRRAYRQDIPDSQAFAGGHPEELRGITRTHAIAWRGDLTRQALAHDTIWHKPGARSSLDADRCDTQAVWHHPGLGCTRRGSRHREGLMAALGKHQARTRVEAPPEAPLNRQRDRSIPVRLRFHAIRRDQLDRLKVGESQPCQGVPYLRLEGTGDMGRDRKAATEARRRMAVSSVAPERDQDLEGPLFRPVKTDTTSTPAKALSPAPGDGDTVKPSARGEASTRFPRGVCSPCGPWRPAMAWSIRRTSSRCRSGEGTRTS
jgi:integrase/recombinase XerD